MSNPTAQALNTTLVPGTKPPAHSTPHIEWFGDSGRPNREQPDSRYGWLAEPAGVCIIKAMDPGLMVYNQTLLVHERRAMAELARLGAPVPTVVDLGRPDWLVTRFAGLSMRVLRADGGFCTGSALARFPLAERLSVWVNLLRRLHPLADAGVLIVDLHSGNVVVPLAGQTAGQLRLKEPGVIDHAHTVVAGAGLRRPVWIDANSAYLAPEIKPSLKADQRVHREHFERLGADLPSARNLPPERLERSRKVWAEYSCEQELQKLVDSGDLNCQAAMQFAVAAAMGDIAELAPAAARHGLVNVIRTMQASAPGQRYPSLMDAADALCAAFTATLPIVSAWSYPSLRPHDVLPATPDGRSPSSTVLTHCDSTDPQPAPAPSRESSGTHGDGWMWWFGATTALATMVGLL